MTKYLTFVNESNVGVALEAFQAIVDGWQIDVIEATAGRLPPDQWDILRKIALKRDEYTCQNCKKDNVSLDVHHVVPVGNGGTNNLTNLKSLCFVCHKKIHPWLGVR